MKIVTLITVITLASLSIACTRNERILAGAAIGAVAGAAIIGASQPQRQVIYQQPQYYQPRPQYQERRRYYDDRPRYDDYGY